MEKQLELKRATRVFVPILVALGSIIAPLSGCAPHPSPVPIDVPKKPLAEGPELSISKSSVSEEEISALSSAVYQAALGLSGETCTIPKDTILLSGDYKPLGTVSETVQSCVVDRRDNKIDVVLVPDPDNPDPKNRAIVEDNESIQCWTLPPEETMVESSATVTPSPPPEGSGLQPNIATIEAQILETQRLLDCLDLRPNVEACAQRAGSEIAELSILEDLIVKAQTSSSSKEKMENTLSVIRKIDSEGRIRWYEFKYKDLFGTVQTGRGVLSFIKGRDFFVNLVLPRNQQVMATVLGLDFHEMYHTIEAYERFLEGADPSFDKAPPDEEKYANFYGHLVEKIARMNGYQGESRSELLTHCGIDMVEVVYYLDQKNLGPDSSIFHYLFELHYRYQLLRQNNVLEEGLIINPDDQERRYRLQENTRQIGEIERKWHNFPPGDSAELEIVETLRKESWVASDFFISNLTH